MKAYLKIIIPATIAIILISIFVFLCIPRNLGNTLRFDDCEWVSISILANEIVSDQDGSQSVSEAESFTFQRDADEFAAINNLLSGYSYNMTFARNSGILSSNGATTSITIFGENGSSLFLSNTSGRNIAVNGTPRRMSENKVIELLDKIIGVCA